MDTRGGEGRSISRDVSTDRPLERAATDGWATVMTDRNEFAEPAEILLVEPSDEIVEALRTGFSDGRSKTTLHRVTAAEAALEFLERRGEYADAPVPCLVLLRADLPDPGPDGIEVLEAMSRERELARIPTLVLAASPTDAVVRQAYERGANAVVPTPDDPDALTEVMESVAQFWIATARLPNREDRI